MNEKVYIFKRLTKAKLQSLMFYANRIHPVNPRKVVFTTIEGTTGFTCNPKYIALELIEQNKKLPTSEQYELVWLVNDMKKAADFPEEIRVVENTLSNRARELSTAKFWIDNSRKQLEVRKRKGQIYIQTWHAKLGFKPTCLDRGASFSRIAYLVSKHDSDMVDYWLSNSDWYDKTLKTGSLYEGKTIRCGSPRCDVLVRAKDDAEYKRDVKKKLCQLYEIDDKVSKEIKIDDVHFMMYAPTFRGGSQGTNRTVDVGDHFPNYKELKDSLERRFGGIWYIMLRLHPQLVARGLGADSTNGTGYLVDGSIKDDMYELLAGCDAFMTDYSSAAFDAAVMDIPIFLYCDDYQEYEGERGNLLWDLRELPFPLAENNEELLDVVERFDENTYQNAIMHLNRGNNILENGCGAKEVVKNIELISNND